MKTRVAAVVTSVLAVLATAPAAAQLKTNVAPVPGRTTASSTATAAQTPAIIANFPVFSGAARKSFSSTRYDVTWQERANYTASATEESVAGAYGQQIVAAGWTAGSRAESGSAATKNHQFTLDFSKDMTKAHLVVAQAAQGTTLALALTTVFAKGAPPLSAGVTAAPASGDATSAADVGSRDPTDFPRLPGSKRASFDVSVGASATREVAAYTAQCAPANADAFYAQNLPRAGWNETKRYEYVDDVARTQEVQLTWQHASRTAAIALNAGSAGTTSARVTLTTDTAPGAVTVAPSAAAAAGARTTVQSAVTNLTTVGTTATTVTLSWAPPPGGAAGYHVYQATGSGTFALVATLTSGTTQHTSSGLMPDSAYNFEVAPVYMAAKGGAATSEGAATAPMTARTKPGLPPAALGAIIASPAVDIALAWPTVSEAAGYLLFRDGVELMQPTTPVTSTEYIDHGVPPGEHTYSVASIYKTTDHGFVEGQLSGLPSAKVAVASGVYRLVLEQVIVNRATSDTQLSTDGEGDEIYVTVDTDLVAMAGAAVASNTVHSWTYGDTRVPDGDRTLAGTVSAGGGLRTGDALPNNTGPCAAKDNNHLCIPFEIFRGQLMKDEVTAYITPRVWEWDGLNDLFTSALAARRKQVQTSLQHGANVAWAQALSSLQRLQIPATGAPTDPAAGPATGAPTDPAGVSATGAAADAAAAKAELELRKELARMEAMAAKVEEEEKKYEEQKKLDLLAWLEALTGNGQQQPVPLDVCPTVPWCSALSKLLPEISPLLVTGLQKLSQNRPIGIQSATFNVLKGQRYYLFDDLVIPLSYDVAEGLASGSISTAGLGAGEFQLVFADVDDTAESSGGTYTLKFVVQRCASMSSC
jgi:hypothetical protein